MVTQGTGCKWYLPTPGEIIALGEPVPQRSSQAVRRGWRSPSRTDPSRAQREWYGAVAGLNELLNTCFEPPPTLTLEGVSSAVEGVIIAGPFPVLEKADLMARFSSWTLTGNQGMARVGLPSQMLPAADVVASAAAGTATLPLLPDDPLGVEPFCLVLTAEFSLLMTLSSCAEDAAGETERFMFSFTPEVVWQGWRSLRSRLEITAPQVVSKLDLLVEHFAPVTPDYRLVADFSRLMLTHLPDPSNFRGTRQNPYGTSVHTVSQSLLSRKKLLNLNMASSMKSEAVSWRSRNGQSNRTRSLHGQGLPVEPSLDAGADDTAAAMTDTDLLRAIAHEVRTPLATIRTLTRLLLRRKDLPAPAMQRLEMIDRECTKQIDRFNLIFRAVEIETRSDDTPQSPLARISLADVLKENLPRWQHQAEQRNLTLNIFLPKRLPLVMCDPTMLDQMLKGLIDQLTHTLPSGSHIEIQAMPVGNQLKLQFYSKFVQPSMPNGFDGPNGAAPMGLFSSIFNPSLKALGHLLMFQPETGNLSLNLDTTKNLFQALGGKFTIRQHPSQGEVLTIFLPLDDAEELA